MMQKEKIAYDGNEIYELKEEYLEGSVFAEMEGMLLELQEVGGRFVSINVPIDAEIGTAIEISYKTPDPVARKHTHDRVAVLEMIIQEQEKRIKTLEEAVRNRVDLNTFNTWLRSLENKLGVEIISQSFQSPYA